MNYTVKEVNTKVTLGMLLRKDGVGLSGESPTVEVRRLSDSKYLDFSAVGPPYWVSSGGQQEKLLTPAAWCDGLYEWEFDHEFYDYNNIGEYEAIYRNTGVNATIATEVVSYEANATKLNLEGIHVFDFPDSPGYSAGDGNAWEYIKNSSDLIVWKRQLSYKDAMGVVQPLLENMPEATPNNKPVIVGDWIKVL